MWSFYLFHFILFYFIFLCSKKIENQEKSEIIKKWKDTAWSENRAVLALANISGAAYLGEIPDSSWILWLLTATDEALDTLANPKSQITPVVYYYQFDSKGILSQKNKKEITFQDIISWCHFNLF